MQLKQLIKKMMGAPAEEKDGSTQIDDPSIIESFISNPYNPFLVSFPRTGSHWLRLLMELYFERPSLVRAFYYPEQRDYLTLHTHDVELKLERRNIIYLYRDPVDTVYSQLNYHKEPLDDNDRIVHWTDLYARHLAKWLFRETFTIKKTVLTYDGMRADTATEFSKVTSHFGLVLDREKLAAVSSRITKDEVKRKTTHDAQVIQTADNYAEQRSEFRASKSKLVWDRSLTVEPKLKDFFKK